MQTFLPPTIFERIPLCANCTDLAAAISVCHFDCSRNDSPRQGYGLGQYGQFSPALRKPKGAETRLNRITGLIAISWAVVAILLSSPLIK